MNLAWVRGEVGWCGGEGEEQEGWGGGEGGGIRVPLNLGIGQALIINRGPGFRSATVYATA